MEKRPKDMTPQELAALPVRSTLDRSDPRPRPSPIFVDDLVGYWRDDNDGQWYRDAD